MAYSVNKAIILGNVGRDPEVRHTQSGKAVANFSVAISSGHGTQECPDCDADSGEVCETCGDTYEVPCPNCEDGHDPGVVDCPECSGTGVWG